MAFVIIYLFIVFIIESVSLLYNIMTYKIRFSEQSFFLELTAGAERLDLAGT